MRSLVTSGCTDGEPNERALSQNVEIGTRTHHYAMISNHPFAEGFGIVADGSEVMRRKYEVGGGRKDLANRRLSSSAISLSSEPARCALEP